MSKLVWISDLHLDQVSADRRQSFYERLSRSPGEAVVLTGDLSNGKQLPIHLLQLAEACGDRPLYFVLGNHDFYFSSFVHVQRAVRSACAKRNNLHFLEDGSIVPLGDHEALLGVGGWADGKAGNGFRSRVRNPDFWNIDDFQSKRWKSCYSFMSSLGENSARYARSVLPYALTCYRHVWFATHVPPFTQSATWNGKQCNYDFQPHYTNVSLGRVLWGLSSAFSSSVSVLAGHTHSEISLSLRPNLHVRTAGVSPGDPWYHLLSTKIDFSPCS